MYYRMLRLGALGCGAVCLPQAQHAQASDSPHGSAQRTSMWWLFAILKDFGRGFHAALSREDDTFSRRVARFGHLSRVSVGEVAACAPLAPYAIRTLHLYKRLPKADWGDRVPPCNPWGAVVHTNVRYGSRARNTLDIYVPHGTFMSLRASSGTTGPPVPLRRVVFWVHGGLWMWG